MSIRSDVAVAVSAKAKVFLSEDTIRWMTNDCDSSVDSAEGSFFLFKDIKWYRGSDTEIDKLYAELQKAEDSDYLIIEACHDYPTSDEGDAGSWYDNPWNIHRCVSVEITWCEPG